MEKKRLSYSNVCLYFFLMPIMFFVFEKSAISYGNDKATIKNDCINVEAFDKLKEHIIVKGYKEELNSGFIVTLQVNLLNNNEATLHYMSSDNLIKIYDNNLFYGLASENNKIVISDYHLKGSNIYMEKIKVHFCTEVIRYIYNSREGNNKWPINLFEN